MKCPRLIKKTERLGHWKVIYSCSVHRKQGGKSEPKAYRNSQLSESSEEKLVRPKLRSKDCEYRHMQWVPSRSIPLFLERLCGSLTGPDLISQGGSKQMTSMHTGCLPFGPIFKSLSNPASQPNTCKYVYSTRPTHTGTCAHAHTCTHMHGNTCMRIYTWHPGISSIL